MTERLTKLTFSDLAVTSMVLGLSPAHDNVWESVRLYSNQYRVNPVDFT